MNTRIFLILAALAPLTLSACVSTPTDALSLEAIAPSTETPEQPGVRKTGEFPTIGNVPQGATTQMTAAEKAQVKRELAPAAARSQNNNIEATKAKYRKSVSEMEELLKYHDKKKAEPDYD